MRKWWMLSVLTVLFVAAARVPVVDGAQQFERVKIAYDAYAVVDSPYPFGIEKGFYRDEGLELQYVRVPTERKGTVMALKDRSAVDMVTDAATPFLATFNALKEEGGDALKRDWPIKIILVHVWSYFGLIARPEYPTLDKVIADGGALGVSKVGAFAHRYTEGCIRAAGYEPAKVKFTPAGNSQERMQKLYKKPLLGGADIVGSALTPPYDIALKLLGYPELIPSAKCPRVPDMALVVRSEDLRERQVQVKKVLKATLRALDYIVDPKNKKEVIQFMIRQYKLGDSVKDVLSLGAKVSVEEYAEKVYETMLPVWNRGGVATETQMRVYAEMMLGAGLKEVDPAVYSDFTFAKEVRQR